MDWPTLIISTAAKIVFMLMIVLGLAPLLVWAERRQSAMIQDRVGPHRAGIQLFGKTWTLGGLLHPLADALKMVFKEDFVPPRADKMLHALGPIISLVPALSVFAVIPFGDLLYLEAIGDVVHKVSDTTLCIWDVESAACLAESQRNMQAGGLIPLQIAPLGLGLLFVFALAGTGVIGGAIAGYASNNKYSLLGGLRAAGQMVSYEVALGLSLVGCLMIYSTVELNSMVRWQSEHLWGIVLQPVAFLLYMIAAIAETKRIPFDVPEGESELVGGYFTEYSGMKFGMFFMGEFMEVIFLAALAVTIFLGGWDIPGLQASGFHWGDTILWHLPHGVVVLLQIAAFIIKMLLLIWFQLMIRWSLPRFRYDQIMALCWKYLLPGSLINILLTAIAILCFA